MSDVEKAFIKPATVKPGNTPLRVRKPTGGVLADEGEEVVMDSFWLRRIADGDVVVVKPAAKTTKKEA